jgi:predicted aspartyl protease
MGQVNTRIRVANWLDLEKVAIGERTEPPRAAEVDALVDTGAVRFYLRTSVVQQLGLRPIRKVTSRTMADVSVERMVFSPVDLEIQGRSGTFEVVEWPDALPNVVGQIPLEQLDWVVDSRGRRLIPNPEHKHGELCDDF